jgi:serine phosphatase RsbU (regulator of sigma subunit)
VDGHELVAPDTLGAVPVPDGHRCFAAARLQGRGGLTLGALLVGTDEGLGAPVERAVLQQFARTVGLVVGSVAGTDADHELAVALQRILLPEWAVPPPGLDVAARYVASPTQAQVGGDFYELLELDGDHVLAAIGDVVGHSMQAATVMAELRNALRAYALDGHGPGAVLERLERLLRRFHPTITASVCIVVIDRPGRRATVVNAGHPPPLVIDGGVAKPVREHGALLGFGLPQPPTATFDLGPDATLLLVTDGLFERRGDTVDHGLDRVVEVATSWSGSLDALCDRLLREVGPGGDASDDIALLALRLRDRKGEAEG